MLNRRSAIFSEQLGDLIACKGRCEVRAPANITHYHLLLLQFSVFFKQQTAGMLKISPTGIITDAENDTV